MKERKKWKRVIKKFERITKTRPKSYRADDSLYTTGLLYERLYARFGIKSDKENALKSFLGVIRQYSKSTLVDDAQKHIGDIRFKERDIKKAVNAFKKASKNRKAVSGKVDKRSQKLARLTSVKRYSRDGYTRLVLHLSNRTAYRAHRLKNPDRVFIDFLDTGFSPSVPELIRYKNGMAKSLRVAKNNASVTRVVVDFAEQKAFHKVTALYNPYRVVIDIGRNNIDKIAKQSASRKVKKHASLTSYTPSQKRKSRIKTIVIDPGHGGRDPGAIGPSGIKEKEITLAIAKKLKKELKKKLNARVILTRSSDTFLELDERTVIANSFNADLFISIHVNASSNRRAHGIETYFLSPARSKDELETAARENMISAKNASEAENDLTYILSDLENTSKVNDSVQLASAVQRSTINGMRKSHSSIKDKGVKQAMFYVLWRATMPSILVETGFITNRTEEKRLKRRSYIKQMAKSIATGIVKYSRTYMVAQNR